MKIILRAIETFISRDCSDSETFSLFFCLFLYIPFFKYSLGAAIGEDLRSFSGNKLNIVFENTIAVYRLMTLQTEKKLAFL